MVKKLPLFLKYKDQHTVFRPTVILHYDIEEDPTLVNKESLEDLEDIESVVKFGRWPRPFFFFPKKGFHLRLLLLLRR